MDNNTSTWTRWHQRLMLSLAQTTKERQSGWRSCITEQDDDKNNNSCGNSICRLQHSVASESRMSVCSKRGSDDSVNNHCYRLTLSAPATTFGQLRIGKGSSFRENPQAKPFPAQLLFRSAISQILFIFTVLFSLTHLSQQLLLMAKAASGSYEAPLAQSKFASARHFYPRPLDISGMGVVSKHKRPSSTKNEKQKSTATQDHLSVYRYELTDTGSGRQLEFDEGEGEEEGKQRQQERASTTGSGTATDVKDSSSQTTAVGKLSAIQNQIANLRRQLKLELAGQRQAALGSPCLTSADCTKSIARSHCKLDTQTCSCLPQHVELNLTTCLPPSLLGYECLIDAQCQQKVPDSYCSNDGVCSCPAEFVSFRKDKCLPASKVNDYCLTDRQCRLADKHSHCKWKIPHVYGICKCPPNYKPTTVNSSIVGNETATTATAIATATRCAPRLGDSCLDHEDCLLATHNSFCREPRHSDTRQTSWPTSGASERKCFCAQGYIESPNRLDCRPVADAQLALATRAPPAKTAVAAAAVAATEPIATVGVATTTRLPENLGAATTLETTISVGFGTGAGGTANTSTIGQQPASAVQQQKRPILLLLKPVASASAQFALSVSSSMDAKHHYELVIANQSHVLVGAPGANSSLDSRETTFKTTTTAAVTVTTRAPSTSPRTSSSSLALEEPTDGAKLNDKPRAPTTTSPRKLATPAATTATATSTATAISSSEATAATTTTTAAPATRSPPAISSIRGAGNSTHNGQQLSESLQKQQQAATANFRMSSLGKSCSSRRDCQAKDPHSDCINGICECLAPTSRCSANSTGCHDDTFQCRNGQCISWYFVCDQFENCDDGSDEADCSPGGRDEDSRNDNENASHDQQSKRKCPPETFECGNGACLALGKLCNGRRDCLDGSDELHCSWLPPMRLATLSHRGSAGSQSHAQVVSSALTVTAIATATATVAAPEVGRPASDCHPKTFACDNGQCLPAYVFCNAVEDCADGSDEDEQLCERAPLWALPPLGRKSQTAIPAGGSDSHGAGVAGSSLAIMPSPTHSDSSSDGGGSSITRPLTSPSPALLLAPSAQKQESLAFVGGSRGHATPTDSPLVKADRTAIEKMLATLGNFAARTPEKRGRPRRQKVSSLSSQSPLSLQSRADRIISRHRRSPLSTAGQLQQQQLEPTSKRIKQQTIRNQQQQQQAVARNGGRRGQRQSRLVTSGAGQLECPKSTFTCRNGKCRSSAILCSGVNGCGDNSDEDRCEVCQCEPPSPSHAKAPPTANKARTNTAS